MYLRNVVDAFRKNEIPNSAAMLILKSIVTTSVLSSALLYTVI